MEYYSSLQLVVKYELDRIWLISLISMQICHNDQSLFYGKGDDNQQRNVGGNRVIWTERRYRSSGLLPANWCRLSWCGYKLSNSGDSLKLLIPSYILIYICGWNNYSGKVISQKINESEMGYRGSKYNK